MTRTPNLRQRQRGAVAVMLGLAIIALFGFMGLALDLGHTYIARTELQNAADAAALAGAKDLNQTLLGVHAARDTAIAIAAQHNFNFGVPIAITAESPVNLWVGPAPNGPWTPINGITTDAEAAGKTFLKVDTGARTLSTWFMSVLGTLNTSTFGLAVAGRFVVDVTPIGICAVDPNVTSKYTATNELVELGFRRGVAYDLFELGRLGGPSDPWLINPVDVNPGPCDPNHSSANFTAPFVCIGDSAVVATIPGHVWGNSGLSDSVLKALNSRFDDYGGGSRCDSVSAPPDINIKEYAYNRAAGSGGPRDWMQPSANTLPNQQTVSVDTTTHKPLYALPPSAAPNLAFGQYGALWSYGPAYRATTDSPPQAGTSFTPTEANATAMYDTIAGTTYFDTTSSSGYPTSAGSGFAAGTPAAPYNQTNSSQYWTNPSPSHPGKVNRRVLRLVIADCPNITTGSCPGAKDIPFLGVGKFFMQVKADPTGHKKIQVEFAGLVEPVQTTEIKLYQ